MQHWPLLVSKLIDHAAATYPRREIVTLPVAGGVHRSDWATVAGRSRRLAGWLLRNGIRPGDRVGTLAWNTHRHVEAWYGVTGAGAVIHTVNPRLFREQIRYIINHAEDRVLLVDTTFLPIVEELAPSLATVERFVVLTDAAHMPESGLDLLCYEDLLASVEPLGTWVEVEETAPAGLSYTSGTTGNPKGVAYTHRSNVLVSMAISQDDMFGLSSRSTVLPIVPFYHANGWAIPWAAAMTGAKLVLPGPNMDARTVRRLIVDEGVTMAGAVPTVWQGMLQEVEAEGGDFGSLRRAVVGGSAAPRSVIERLEQHYGLCVINSWGMTETSPLGTVGMLCGAVVAEPYETQLDFKAKKGRPPFGVELKVVDEQGDELPRDGVSPGRVMVKGPWVVDRYFGAAASAQDGDGFFDTGDIGTVDPLGYLQLTDRAKDIVKSGGEWISSIDLENLAMGCPGVAEAAVVGVPHPRWDERPLLVVVRAPGSAITERDVYAFLEGRIAKWWTPDLVLFVDEIPHTATGKIQKTTLRERYRDLLMPAADPVPHAATPR